MSEKAQAEVVELSSEGVGSASSSKNSGSIIDDNEETPSVQDALQSDGTSDHEGDVADLSSGKISGNIDVLFDDQKVKNTVHNEIYKV